MIYQKKHLTRTTPCIYTQKNNKQKNHGYFISPLQPWIVNGKQIDNVKIHRIKRGVLYFNFDLRIKRYIFVLKTM